MPRSKIIAAVVIAVILLGAGIFLLVKLLNNGTAIVATDSIANPPIGCPSATTIVVSSEEAGTQHISTTNSNFIHWREDQGLLIFTNYTLDPDSVYSNITEGRVLTVVKLSHEDGTALAEGTYRKTAEEGEETPNQYSPEYNISTPGLAGGVFDDEATVEVTHLGTDYVCGTVTSDDGDSSIKGDFIARYINNL